MQYFDYQNTHDTYPTARRKSILWEGKTRNVGNQFKIWSGFYVCHYRTVCNAVLLQATL